jgi:hypothetical protein
MLDAITYTVMPIHQKARRAKSSGNKQNLMDTRLEAVDRQIDSAFKQKMRQASRDFRGGAEEGADTIISARQTLRRAG